MSRFLGSIVFSRKPLALRLPIIALLVIGLLLQALKLYPVTIALLLVMMFIAVSIGFVALFAISETRLASSVSPSIERKLEVEQLTFVIPSFQSHEPSLTSGVHSPQAWVSSS